MPCLVANYDAQNTGSYPMSGSIWYNLEDTSSLAGGITGALWTSNYSGSFYFDGSSNVSIGQPLLSGSGAYTIQAWIYPTDVTQARNIVSSQSSPFWISSGNLYGGVGNNYTAVGSTITPNSWYQVAVTFDDATDTMVLYKNGVQVDINTSVSQTYVSENTYIGSHWVGSAVSFFLGNIGLVKIYNCALSGAEILTEYNARESNFPNPTPTPTPTTTPTSTPTPTPTPTPTNTPTPSPTPTPTPTPTAYFPNCPPNQFGGSMYFDGNAYVEMQSSSLWTVGRGDFTFEWYMKYTDVTPTQSIFYLGGPYDSLGHMSARLFGNRLGFTMNNQIVVEGDLTNIYNNWTHVAISHKNDKLYIFQDGYLVSANALNNTANVTSSEHPFRIGGSPTFSSYLYYHGYITNFHYVKGEGLYDGSKHSQGHRVFYKPIPPISPVENTKILLLSDYTCDPAYNSAPNVQVSKTNHGMVYDTDYPQVSKLNVCIVDFVSNTFFGLGNEKVTPIDVGFSYGDRITLQATQNKYSFDYYEIHPPITVANSNLFYTTYYGYTASFDPKTEVFMNTDTDVSSSNCLIVAHYR